MTVVTRLVAIGVALLSLTTTSACQQSTSPNPAVPTPPIPEASAVTLVGVPTRLAVGDSVQLTAAVTLADGSRKLSDAVWMSSNDNVATVSPSGLLTVIGRGGADITTTAYEHLASVHVRVPYIVAGVIHETVPTEDSPVAGARVEVKGSSDDGIAATTDSGGRFSLEVENAGITLAVSKEGYDSGSLAIVLPRDEHPSIGLMPDDGRVSRKFEGGICADANFWLPDLTYRPCIGPITGRHITRFHRAGIVELDLDWVYQEDYSSEHMWLEVDCSGVHLSQAFSKLWMRKPVPFNPNPVLDPTAPQDPLPWKFSVPGPGACEIKPSRYSSFKGSIANTVYRITTTQPR